jgi:hypothetical protein
MQYVSYILRYDPRGWAEAYYWLLDALLEATDSAAASRRVRYYPDKTRS